MMLKMRFVFFPQLILHNYNYEVALSIRMNTLNGSSGGTCNCTITTTFDSLNKYLTQNSTQVSSFDYVYINSTRTMTFKIQNHKLDDTKIIAYRYRRLGTNS